MARKQYILIKGKEVLVLSALLTKDENGLEYPRDCYKDEMVEGMYVPDTVKLEADSKLKAKEVINLDYTTKVNALTVDVPNNEILTWIKQESEARSYLADNTVATPLIDALCAARGIAKDYLIGKIIQKADAYAVAIGTLTGERQKAEDGLI